MRLALALLATVALAAAQAPRPATVIVSDTGGRRMSEIRDVAVRPGEPRGDAAIRVDPKQRFQRIDGFGATLTEAGSMVLRRLPRPQQEDVLRRIFDASAGAGFSLMKSPAAAFDFAAAGPWYTYDDTPGDVGLKRFSIARDLRPDGLVTFIQRARRYGKFAIQSTTDYPPDWMLDEKQNLKPEYYDAFARYWIRYLQDYKKRGIDIDYLAPFNEPQFIYCKIKYPEIATLIREHLGPALQRSGLSTKLQACESHNRRVGAERLPSILDDPGARRYISSISVHGYDWENQTSEPLRMLHSKYPDLSIWQSEVCYAEVIDKQKVMPVRGFEDGDRWGRMIVADLLAGASGWIYWNLILDEKGAPWLVSESHHDPAYNPQHPLVIINGATREVEYTGAFWYLAHFSKYVRPGAVRVGSDGKLAGIAHVAFEAPDGSVIVQIVNSGPERRAEVAVSGGYSEVAVPAHGIATVIVPRAN